MDEEVVEDVNYDVDGYANDQVENDEEFNVDCDVVDDGYVHVDGDVCERRLMKTSAGDIWLRRLLCDVWLRCLVVTSGSDDWWRRLVTTNCYYNTIVTCIQIYTVSIAVTSQCFSHKYSIGPQ